jgi:poly(3-hydroxybutyrate) depolymerase
LSGLAVLLYHAGMISPVKASLSLLLAVMCCACAGCPIFQTQDTPVPELQKFEASTHSTYWLYVPSNYQADRPTALVVTLHGTPGFDDASAQVREWKNLAEENHFIVLSPQLASTQGILPVGSQTRIRDVQADEQRILACVQEVRRQYNIAPDSIGLTGFSGGGYAMYYTGLRHADIFAAVVARECSSDVSLLADIQPTDQARKMPILIFCGSTSINPLASGLNPILDQSRKVYAYLLEHDYKKAKFKMTEGGHYRRPEMAYRFFTRTLPALK